MALKGLLRLAGVQIAALCARDCCTVEAEVRVLVAVTGSDDWMLELQRAGGVASKRGAEQYNVCKQLEVSSGL